MAAKIWQRSRRNNGEKSRAISVSGSAGHGGTALGKNDGGGWRRGAGQMWRSAHHNAQRAYQHNGVAAMAKNSGISKRWQRGSGIGSSAKHRAIALYRITARRRWHGASWRLRASCVWIAANMRMIRKRAGRRAYRALLMKNDAGCGVWRGGCSDYRTDSKSRGVQRGAWRDDIDWWICRKHMACRGACIDKARGSTTLSGGIAASLPHHY